MRVTYWLYWGDKILTAVRGSKGLSDTEVRAIAIEQHNRVPLHTEVAPVEFRSMLSRSEVVTYPAGN